jgi:hypothetical protein
MFITTRDDFDFKPMWGGVVKLQGALHWKDPEHDILIPDAFLCDLASYKVISKIIFDKLGKSMRPAVLHDWLYRMQPEGVSRKVADDIFYEALLEEGYSKASAKAHWLGVRAGGWVAWNKHRKAMERG